jgi:hypothetical protein
MVTPTMPFSGLRLGPSVGLSCVQTTLLKEFYLSSSKTSTYSP